MTKKQNPDFSDIRGAGFRLDSEELQRIQKMRQAQENGGGKKAASSTPQAQSRTSSGYLGKVAKFGGLALAGYATAPYTVIPAAVGYLTWKNRAILMPKSIKGAIVKLGLAVGASYVALNALSDMHTQGQSLTTAVGSNATYAGHAALNKSAQFAAEKGVPCIDSPLNCGKDLLTSAWDTAVDGGTSGFHLYNKHIAFPFYRANYNTILARPLEGTFLESVFPVSVPYDTVDLDEEVVSEKKNEKSGASKNTQVEFCKQLISDESTAVSADGKRVTTDTFNLRIAYWNIMNKRLDEAKSNPETAVGRALADAEKTGHTAVIVFPDQDAYIDAYNAMRDNGQVKTTAEFNKLVAKIDQTEDHALNFTAYTSKRSAHSQCPKNEKWMTVASQINGNPSPIRYYLSEVKGMSFEKK